MKIGHKLLFTNGRGNQRPTSLMRRGYLKKIANKIASLKNNPFTAESKEKLINTFEREVNASKHGEHNTHRLKKALNTKIRQMKKKELKDELNNEY